MTGAVVRSAVTLMAIFTVAGLFLPLLLNFGLLEFVGIKCTPIMQKLFNLPGGSAVGCLASWFGDGSVGVMITNQQYENKKYTQREAVVIATSFSAVSLTFTLVILSQVHLEDLFSLFYLTVCVTGLVCAVIMPKIPPLSWKKEVYIDGSPKQVSASPVALDSSWQYAFEQARSCCAG